MGGDIDWVGRMARLPDEDVVEIVASGDTGGYDQAVIEAATAELQRRKPDAGLVAGVEASVRGEQARRDGRKTEPLSNAAWVAYVLFGLFFLFTIPSVIMLATTGYHQKAKDAAWGIALSFVFWGLISTVMAFFLG